jgi:hypothetical protein
LRGFDDIKFVRSLGFQSGAAGKFRGNFVLIPLGYRKPLVVLVVDRVRFIQVVIIRIVVLLGLRVTSLNRYLEVTRSDLEPLRVFRFQF